MEQINILEGDALLNFLNPSEEVKEEKKPETVDDLFDNPKEEDTPKAEETPKEVIVEEKVITQPEPKVEKNKFYAGLVGTLIEKGEWKDFMVQFDEDSEPKLISELGDIDKEVFEQLLSTQKEEREKDFESKYISLEGVDDVTRQIIEIKRQGGDITQVLEAHSRIKNPLDNVDLDNESHMKELVGYKLMAQYNNDIEVVNLKLAGIIKEGNLDIEAKKVYEEIETNYKGFLDQELQKVKEEQQQTEQKRKDFRKNISEVFKSYGLNDGEYRTLVDSASKYKEDGTTEVDNLFKETKNDPERYAKLVMFLKNPKLFDDKYSTKIRNKANLDAVKKIYRVSPETSTERVKQKPVTDSFDKLFDK